MDRYDTNSKGTSPALSALLNQFASMPRSAFDETRTKDFDVPPYAIIPVECFLMFPNSEGYLTYDVQAITKNPTIRRMFSNATIELRTYSLKISDSWEGWNNFITRGRSGKVNMTIPSLNFLHTGSDTKVRTTSFPYSPYHYLNISPAVKFDKSQSFEYNSGIREMTREITVGGETVEMVDDTGLLGSSFNIASSNTYNKGQSAIPGVMYTKIAKEYQNSNLLQSNPYWYPENENHDLILPYSCSEARTASYDYPNAEFGTTVDSESLNSVSPTNDKHSMPWLNTIYYRQRRGDMFNTGSPFPDLIRGDVPTLEVLSASADFTNAVYSGNDYTLANALGNYTIVDGEGNRISSLVSGIINTDSADPNVNGRVMPNPNTTQAYKDLIQVLNKNTISGINFSMAMWTKLATLTEFKRRMARTDGSYNQMIEAQFRHNPKWHEHSVYYCGGSTQPIVFSEVVQNSGDSDTPLGTTGGRAMSASTSREIYVKADDYTIFMTVMTITPNTVYSQGIDRMWSTLNQADQYFPIMNNLEPQAILNKELFISGTDNTDEDVFNYQERFCEFKSRQNQVSGLMALPIDKVGDTGAYVFNRLFTSTPQFNHNFVEGKFTDNENLCFASTEQAQFCMHVSSMFKYVAPMPAVTQPSDMGLSY